MEPVNFPEANTKLTAPGCGDLPVLNDGHVLLSCWDLSEEERQRIADGGKLWLVIVGQLHPPVAVSTECPINKQDQWPDEITEKSES